MKLSRRHFPRPIGGLALAGLTLIPCLALSSALHAGEPDPADVAGAPQPVLEELSRQFRAVARRVEPSVVHIEVLGARRPAPGASQNALPRDPGRLLERFFQDPRGGLRLAPQPPSGQGNPYHEFDLPPRTGTGSGWVFDGEGHIVTNHHVVDGAREIRVRLFDGTERDARLVASDARTDVAVLAVDDAEGLVPARLSGESPQQGDIVFAFGSPLSIEFSMSQGIVAGTGRRTGILGPGGYEDFIQTDAAINPGNSGGPLTDVRGRVVGMNSSIASRSGLFSGIGFAIPVPTMRPVIEQLIANGAVHRGFLGVTIQDEPELLRSFGFEGEGVLISDVLPDGPAAGTGLRRGDIVTRVDGEAVEDAEALRLAVAALAPGSRAELELVRDGAERTVVVELGRAPANAAGVGMPAESSGPVPSKGREALRELGLSRVSDLDAANAEALGLELDRGVLVEAVRPTSAAARAGLRPGTVVTEVGEEAVANTADLAARLADADLEQGVRVTVVDAGRQRYAFLRLPR